MVTVKRFSHSLDFYIVFDFWFLLAQLADLTGELMRMAIGRISDGEIEFAQRICQFVRQIHRELMLVVPKMDDSYDMKSKMEVMLQSVIKIENGMHKFHIRTLLDTNQYVFVTLFLFVY